MFSLAHLHALLCDLTEVLGLPSLLQGCASNMVQNAFLLISRHPVMFAVTCCVHSGSISRVVIVMIFCPQSWVTFVLNVLIVPGWQS